MITLLIPTMNRSDFLIRQLNYYRSTGFKGCINIGDSSDAFHVNRVKEAIKALDADLKIVYREYPDTSDSECLRRLVDLIETPYAVYIADDDFLVPKAMDQCAQFLRTNPDYGAAHGAGFIFSLGTDGAHGQVASAHPYRQPVVEGDTAAKRLSKHLGNYEVTLFSVHRSETWRDMYKDISLLTDRTFAGELLPCCLSVVKGKVKELDGLYLVRQDHKHRYYFTGTNCWVRSPEWRAQYQIFRDILAGEVAKQDGISVDKAMEIVERAFDAYISKILGTGWQKRAVPKTSAWVRLQQIGGKVPGARLAWHVLHKPVQDSPDMLLSPSSPYNADFMPIYQRCLLPISSYALVSKS